MQKVHRPIFDGITQALKQILQDQKHLSVVLESAFKSNKKWGSRDRKLVAEAVYDIVRWYRRLDWALGEDVKVRELVLGWLALKDLVYDPEWSPEEFLTRWNSKAPLRAIEYSVTDWFDTKGESELGKETWEQVLPVLNERAPTFIRTNTLKISRKELRADLLKEQIESEAVGDHDALKLLQKPNVFQMQSYKNGCFEMQDLSSQHVAYFAELKPGLRVVDACAGAGGKSLHMAALMQNKGKVLALDIHEWKLEELKKRAARGGVDVIETRWIESNKVIKRLKATADRVLLDVPCSGSGVIRRDPDTKWKLNEDECKKLTELQHFIIQDYSEMVKKGGLLIYSTCSLFPSENSKIVQMFINSSQNAFVLEAENSILPTSGGGDGFYMARMRRLEVSQNEND